MYNEANFNEWPLHDAFVTDIQVNWNTKLLELKLTVFFDRKTNAVESVIEFHDVRDFHMPMESPWGRNKAWVNDQRIAVDGAFLIQMQSGDEIRIVAGSATLRRLTESDDVHSRPGGT